MNPITAFFVGTEVLQTGSGAAKSVKKEMQASNKYDNLLGNKITKAPAAKGVINAANSNPLFRSASEELDFVYKVASEDNRLQRNNNSNNNNNGNGNRKYNNSSNNKSNNYRKDNHDNDYRKMMTKNLREINYEGREDSGINPYLLAASAILAAGGAQAVIQGDIMAPVNSAIKGAKKFTHKIPRKTIGKNKNVRTVMDIFKGATRPLQRKYKFAGEAIDHMFEKEANAPDIMMDTAVQTTRNLSKKQKLKRAIKEDFVRKGIESVPYYAAPATIGYLVGKDIRNPADDENITRVVVDVPMRNLKDVLSKKASAPDLSWKDWSRDVLPTRAVQGLGRTAFPALVIGLTGRNIKGKMEKLEKKEKKKKELGLPPVDMGNARIIIETRDPSGLVNNKIASESIDELVLLKSASNAVRDAENKLKNVTVEEREKKNKRGDRSLMHYDKMRDGVLKQSRMITMKE